MNLRLKKHRATGQQLLAQTGEILKQRFMHERKPNKGATRRNPRVHPLIMSAWQ